MPRLATESKHILAGDDSPVILQLFREILEGEGYRVSGCTRPLELDDIKRLQPDLVILDHMFADGEGSGWQLLRDLRCDPQTAALPVIVCTGAVQRVRDGAELLEALDVGVVLKPFDIEELLRHVEAAWRRPSTDGQDSAAHLAAG